MRMQAFQRRRWRRGMRILPMIGCACGLSDIETVYAGTWRDAQRKDRL
jgi:hypothetical protein